MKQNVEEIVLAGGCFGGWRNCSGSDLGGFWTPNAVTRAVKMSIQATKTTPDMPKLSK